MRLELLRFTLLELLGGEADRCLSLELLSEIDECSSLKERS